MAKKKKVARQSYIFFCICVQENEAKGNLVQVSDLGRIQRTTCTLDLDGDLCEEWEIRNNDE